MNTTVVHCKRSHYDVYIGRPSKFGNPFQVGIDGNREEVIAKYRAWITQPERKWLRNAARAELRGQTIACWCKPKDCHGDVLAEIAETEVEP